MPVSFSPGISVEYAGARWRVLRVLGAESVLLGSDAGEEVAADPLKIRLSGGESLLNRPLDERRYSDADWSEVERRRDVLLALANRPTTTASVAAAAEALGLTPRRIWALLRHARMAGDDVAQFMPARNGPRKKRLGVSVEAIIQQAIDQHYAQRTRPDLNSLVAEIAGRCTAAGLRPPSPKENESSKDRRLLGVLYAAVGAFTFALNNVTMRRGVVTGSVLQGMALTVPIGGLSFLVMTIALGELHDLVVFPIVAVNWLVCQGIVHFVIGRYCNYKSNQLMGVNLTAPVVQLQVPLAMILAVVLLHEIFTVLQAIGAALMLGGSFITQGNAGKRKRVSGPIQTVPSAA